MKDISIMQVYFHIMRDVDKHLNNAPSLQRLIFAVQMVQQQKAVIL